MVLPMAGRELREIIDPEWAQALEPVAGRITAMGEFLRAELAAGRRYLPAGENVLRAFTQPFGAVRVLIDGARSYPPGHAVGLSFSVAPTVQRLPPTCSTSSASTPRILATRLHPPPATWCRGSERGVLLLNRVLTVRPGQPASHRGQGWEEVTEQAIRALAARPGPDGTGHAPLVAILWGRDARSLAPLLDGVPLIESAHPSPNSADRGFFGSRPFSRANQLLEQQGAPPIDWKLP